MADTRLNTYLVLHAPVLARTDGVTDNPADLEMAEAILIAAESADGVGLTRSEIAARAGVDVNDPRFNARLGMLARAGALHHLRGDKKHQNRYLPDPIALLAAEILARLDQNHGAEELHSLLVAAADRLEATFGDASGVRAPTPPEVATLIGKLSALLHAYAMRMESALAAGTYEELVRARTGSSTNRQMAQIERICRAINRDSSPYRMLFHDANRLLAAGQRFVSAAEQLTDRLVEVVTTAGSGGVLTLAGYDTYRDAAIHADQARLATVAAGMPIQAPPPLVHLADLATAAAALDMAPRTRCIPEPPRSDRDPRTVITERRRRAEARAEARRGWAHRLVGDSAEVDLTSHATTWPHAARLLADLMAISHDPTVPAAADIGDPPLIEPGAEVTVRHALRIRRLTPRRPTGTTSRVVGGDGKRRAGRAMSDTRLMAARARGYAEAPEAAVLASVEPGLWRIADTGSTPIFTVAADLQLHATDLAGVPVARLSPTPTKVLLALLVATSTGAAHPYPGRLVLVDDVVTVLGGPRLGPQALAHAKGSINKLRGWGLARLGVDDAQVAGADLGVPVRLGVAAALWSGPWVGELTTLVEQIARQRLGR